MLNTGSRKIRCEFVGPLAIWKCVSPTIVYTIALVSTNVLGWKITIPLPHFPSIEETRIKPELQVFVRTTKGNVTHMSGLRQV